MAAGIPQELEQEYNRNKVVKKYFADNQTKVDAYGPLKTAQTTFTNHLGEFEELIPGKDVTTKGITEDKDSIRLTIATTYAPYCLNTRAFAIRYGLTDLAANMNFTETKIMRIADGELQPFVVAINKFITDDALPDPNFAEYEIDATALADGLTLANKFKTRIGKASSVDDAVTAVIQDLIDKNDDLRDDVTNFTLLMSRYKTTDKNFFNGFEAAKKIDDIGVHHAGIEGTCTKNGNPLKDVTVTCVQFPKKIDKTDVIGHYELMNIRPGSYEFTFTHATEGSKTIIIKIERGKIKTVDVAF